MPPTEIILPALANGVLNGGVYALVALGLTLIYGVLHIINFAHGSLLMLAMYGAYFAFTLLHIDPYLALPLLMAAMGVVGYVLYRFVVGPFSHGQDRNILLVTLGCAVVLDNLALVLFKGDSRTIETPYSFKVVEVGGMFLALPRLVSFAVAILLCAALALLIARTDLGRAIRAVARERTGARLVGIDVKGSSRCPSRSGWRRLARPPACCCPASMWHPASATPSSSSPSPSWCWAAWAVSSARWWAA